MRRPRWGHARAWGFLLLAIASGARADSAGTGGTAPSLEVPVVVFNRTITVFRAPFLGVSPADRARRSQAVLDELLGRHGPGVVTTQTEPQGNLLMVDGSLALILTPGDADALRGETLAVATEAAATKLQRAIADTREARDRRRWLRAIGAAILASGLLILGWTLVWRARRWLESRLASLLQRSTPAVKVGGQSLVLGGRMGFVARTLEALVSWPILAVLTYEWTSFVFDQFPYTRAWSEQLDGYLLGVALEIFYAVVHAVPDLLIAAVIFLLARLVIGALGPFFEGVERNQSQAGWLDRDTAKPTRRLFNAAVWSFAVVMAYPYLPGSGSEAFKGVSVLIGVMVTLGGTSLFGQAASGLILMYSRTFRVGEYVRIDAQEGTITELGTFTTKLRTGLGEELTLPNTLVLGAVTRNYSRPAQGGGYVVDTVVTIGYDTPWRQVEGLLIEAASRTNGVVTEPAPRVFKTQLSDFYVEYRLVCDALPTGAAVRAELLSELHARILDVFNEYGVQIMSPHYLGDPERSKVVGMDGWFAAPARKPPAT
ncbi:MAG TPA: mechanosensitive ion channel domain-containing protein [Polyangiales bacterium]|nr:mechanosensitive ion channel domain-containing protein [Polyangiales bacterium]